MILIFFASLGLLKSFSISTSELIFLTRGFEANGLVKFKIRGGILIEGIQ